MRLICVNIVCISYSLYHFIALAFHRSATPQPCTIGIAFGFSGKPITLVTLKQNRAMLRFIIQNLQIGELKRYTHRNTDWRSIIIFEFILRYPLAHAELIRSSWWFHSFPRPSRSQVPDSAAVSLTSRGSLIQRYKISPIIDLRAEYPRALRQ